MGKLDLDREETAMTATTKAVVAVGVWMFLQLLGWVALAHVWIEVVG